jgi:DNA-binding GntR family transcriptional regulator
LSGQTESSSTTSGEDVVDAIREAILAGDLVPGQRLVEAELSESLNVSRGTVRVALMDLAHEGLVERIANRGARVRVVTVDEAVHITEVRMLLEILCAGRAAAQATDAQIADLRAIGAQMSQDVRNGDAQAYSEHNRQLHREVIRIADQPIAEEILDQLRARNVRHAFRLAFRPGRPQESLPLRLAVIEAIARHDVDGAETAARAHMENVLEEFKNFAEAPQFGLRPVR